MLAIPKSLPISAGRVHYLSWRKSGLLFLLTLLIIAIAGCGPSPSRKRQDTSPVVLKDFTNNSCTLQGFQGKNIYAVMSICNRMEGAADTQGELQYTITTNFVNSFSYASLRNLRITYPASINSSSSTGRNSKQMVIDNMLRSQEAEIIKKHAPLTIKTKRTAPAPPVINEVRQFWIAVDEEWTFQQWPFTCKRISTNAYLWVDNRDLAAIADTTLNGFASEFQTMASLLHTTFGNETDSDGDPRTYIIISSAYKDFCGGYFAAQDKFPSATCPNSNEHDAFYVANYTDPYSIEYSKGTLAHEFQHMINFDRHYYHNASVNEESWLNEAFAELASYLCGYGDSSNFLIQEYLDSPSVGLTAWASCNTSYGISLLFGRYLYEQFPTKIKPMVDTANVGIANVETAIEANFNDLFRDFFRAVCLDNTGLTNNPKYQFTTLNLRDGSLGFNGLAKTTPLSIGNSTEYTVYPYQLLLVPLTNISSSATISVTTSDSSTIGGTIVSMNSGQNI
ncbi:MAG TPA: hypothetical protein VHY08_19430 [Bacillota bacterium]|nr:hypothetical protein [Bacillota bacterium]